MFNIILYQPEIPQNTGNIGRLCAFAQAGLHLIHPLGFQITDKSIKRSGMDYWRELDVTEHLSWQAFTQSEQAPKRNWLLTTHASKSIWDADFQAGDGLIFGSESCGAPQEVHDWVGEDFRVTIPKLAPELRSLNLSTSAGIALYEAIRQHKKTSSCEEVS